MRRLRGVVGWVLVAGVGAACSSAAPQSPPPTAGAPSPSAGPNVASRIALPASRLTEEQQILHVLNRLGYGPRPGDVERVRRMGIAAYIAGQLSPEGLPDVGVEQALGDHPILRTASAQLVHEYPEPSNEVRQKLAAGQMTPQETMEVFPPQRRPYAITAQMQAAKVTRAVLSERQLAPGGDGGLLVQPLQRLRHEGRHPIDGACR